MKRPKRSEVSNTKKAVPIEVDRAAGQQPSEREASSAATPGSAASAAHQPSSRYRPVDSAAA